MTDKKLIKPRKGVRVINPANRKPLPEKGARLEVTTYWVRRWSEGEVSIEGRPDANEAEKAPKKSDTEKPTSK